MLLLLLLERVASCRRRGCCGSKVLRCIRRASLAGEHALIESWQNQRNTGALLKLMRAVDGLDRGRRRCRRGCCGSWVSCRRRHWSLGLVR